MVGGEINQSVDMPWERAICTMYQLINIDANHGSHTRTPWSILNSGELELVIWRPNANTAYPEPQSVKNGLYVVGLVGKIRRPESERIRWEIRYDWDPTKGFHVNLHVTTDQTTIYSFNDDYSFGARDARKSFQVFLRWARSATLTSGCYDSTSWAIDSPNAYIHINELEPVVWQEEIHKERYAKAVWKGLFGEGTNIERIWKRYNEGDSSTAEFQNPFKATTRFEEPRDRSIEPRIREYWQCRVQQYLQDRQEYFGLAVIS